MEKNVSNDIQKLINKANELIDEGASIMLFHQLDNLALKVFKGDQFAGGQWKIVDKIFEPNNIELPLRKYGCFRKFVYDGEKITLTSCTVEHCWTQIRDNGPLVDYKVICDLKN